MSENTFKTNTDTSVNTEEIKGVTKKIYNFFMKTIPKTFKHLDTLNNIYSILLVALIITLFEIGLFYYIILPQIRNKIFDGINQFSDSLKEYSDLLDINNTVDNVLSKIFDNKDSLTKMNITTIKNDIKNDIKNKMDEIQINLNNKINEMEKIQNEINNEMEKNQDEMKKNQNKINNKLIENFEQKTKKNNRRKYNQEYNKTIGDQLTETIVKVLKKNNINVSDDTSNYIKILVTMDFNDKTSNILDTLAYDENHIINVNNNNTKVICFLIIFVLLILLTLLYVLINFANMNRGIKAKVYITSAIIFINIIFFLVNFYFMSLEYKYLGGAGNEELVIFLLENIKI
jgi:hypothetical protein